MAGVWRSRPLLRTAMQDDADLFVTAIGVIYDRCPSVSCRSKGTLAMPCGSVGADRPHLCV
ncbi:hypothetical protein MCP1_100020 [Candidatus Terasakiella magnetica]|nr:hypothetical protein MCP1_100020 [Candidatus Terasakiella magnetica]